MFATMKYTKWSMALLAVCLAGSVSRAQDTLPDCYVLSIGVDRYQNANQLRGCINDAKNAAQSFRAQEGALFNKVACTVLLDGQATTQRIHDEMQTLANAGKPGDVAVLFLSGHGDRRNKRWAFLAQDFAANQYTSTTINDEAILRLADTLAAQGKNAFIIVDACFAGQLRLNARDLLARYRDPNAGGIVVMVSSMPNQVSAACGSYSAFAFAVKEGMDGKADFNGDRRVTLQELRRYSYHRVYELQNGNQDSDIDFSLSVSDAMVVSKNFQTEPVATNPPVQDNAGQPNKTNIIRGQLTANDPFDTVRKGCHAKVITVHVPVGQCTIDLVSGNPDFFDTYLRIEDLNGNIIAENDDHGGTLNSQVALNVTQAGQLRVVVTSYAPGATGSFELRVR